MIEQLGTAMSWIHLVAEYALVCWALVGMVLALMAPAGAYEAEGRWRKEGWVLACGLSAAVLYLMTFNFLGIIAMVVVGVFYADVRPAVRGYRR